MHDARHTAGSLLHARGRGRAPTVQEILGHSSITMARRYMRRSRPRPPARSDRAHRESVVRLSSNCNQKCHQMKGATLTLIKGRPDPYGVGRQGIEP
ncbi:hypothetical protein ACU686_44675 [Yinghuangia aomiensis]